MVKFSNKPKGRPSKRRTFKVKYKIERKVKQHNKRVRKEARKLKGKGLRHKGVAKSDFLPNMFPFKQQILTEARNALPKVQQIESNILDKQSYGLITLENKCQYLPKPKDILVKKYVSNLDYTLSTVQVVLELLEAKNPEACIDNELRENCKKKSVTIISILTKADTLSQQQISKKIASMKGKCQVLIPFTNDNKRKQQCIQDVLSAIRTAKAKLILVAGKALTGKHTLITLLAKASKNFQENPNEVQAFKLDQQISLIDSPYKIGDDSGNPMFTVPNPVLEQSLQAQEELLIRRLFIGEGKGNSTFNRNAILQHYSIQDFTTVSDLISKVGRAGKHFGKGGSIDTARVRNKLISDWFSGKLNSLLSP